MGYVGIFIYTAEIHARCKLSHWAALWVRQLCYWSINLKQRNSRKYMGRWCDQNLISYSYHSVIICLLSVSMFVPAAAAQEDPGSGSHSSQFGQCAWVEVVVWQWEMWRAGDSGEDQLEQQTMPVSNSETLLEGTAGWKKMTVSPLPFLEDFYNFQWVKQTVLLNSCPLAKDRYQGFLLLKAISWLDEHRHAMSHTVMYSCPESSSSPYAPLPAVSSCTGWAQGRLSPAVHPAADVELALLSASHLRVVL